MSTSALSHQTTSYLRRANRLLDAATPYPRVFRRQQHQDDEPQQPPPTRANPTPFGDGPAPPTSATNSPTSSSSDASSYGGLSSTASRILNTLQTMSTPLRDAARIPVGGGGGGSGGNSLSRAERRRALAEEILEGGSLLNESSRASSASRSTSLVGSARRRPRLGAGGGGAANGRASLSGPPLRTTLFSPVASSNQPAKSKSNTPIRGNNDSLPALSESVIGALTGGKTSSVKTQQPNSTKSFSFANFNNKSEAPKAPAAASPAEPASQVSFPSSVKPTEGSSSIMKTHDSTPVTTGKIRAKLGEKARARAERAFLDEDAAPPVPAFLQGPAVTGLGNIKAMPKFDFSVPEKANDVVAKPLTNGDSSASHDNSQSELFDFSAPVKLAGDRSSSVSTAAASEVFKFSDPVEMA